jgi:hypothetical protein
MTQSNQNIFEDLGFSAEESENLREEAALKLKTPIDCVEGLMEGDIDQFQVEPLITMLTHAGMKVRIEVVAA